METAPLTSIPSVFSLTSVVKENIETIRNRDKNRCQQTLSDVQSLDTRREETMATLSVRIPLTPYRKSGKTVSRVTLEVTGAGFRASQTVENAGSLDCASPSFDLPAAGPYTIAARVFEREDPIASGEGAVDAADGMNMVTFLLMTPRGDFSPAKASLAGRLSAGTGLRFDLPTEAQWEYACRAGTTKAYNDDTDCLVAEKNDRLKDRNLEPIAWYGGNWNVEGEDSERKRDVGLKAPNAWGLYDMLGNLWEYCLDWYDAYPEDAIDPTGPVQGQKRVVRGGSWHAWAGLCRSAMRQKSRGAFRGQGVRIACSAEGAPPEAACLIVDVSKGAGEKMGVEFAKTVPQDLLTNDAYRTVKIVLKRILAGSFIMGSPPEETGRNPDETPHGVKLTRDFFMGVFMITQKQWELLMGSNNSVKRGEKLPIENVDWEDCRGGLWPPG
jgi:formylglycine-generating enzyme required for sulfatase activity